MKIRIVHWLWLVYTLNFLAWNFKLYDYYFEFKLSDQIGFALSFILPLFFTRRLTTKYLKSAWLVNLWVLGTLFFAYPLVSFLIEISDYSWVSLHVFAVLTAICIAKASISWKPALVAVCLSLTIWLLPIKFFSDQQIYFDKLVETVETRKGKIHRVQWKGRDWIHYSGRLSATGVDAHMYYEPMVHPAMHLIGDSASVLLMGGDNGLALQEIRKYANLSSVHVVPYDEEFFNHFQLIQQGEEIFKDEFFSFLHGDSSLYDVIILDLPDPISLHINQYYTLEFYEKCRSRLKSNGLVITQGLSPYFQPQGHDSIIKTLEAAGFNVTPYHNQVPAIGQWSWVLATQMNSVSSRLENVEVRADTRWWNNSAMRMMLSFGKSDFFGSAEGQVNTVKNASLVKMITK